MDPTASPRPTGPWVPPPAPPARKGSALNVTAFVLSLMVILPLVPLIGTILGIVGVARRRPDLGGRGLAIAAIPVGLGMVFIVQAMIAAVSIPAFVRYTRLARVTEARQTIARLRRGAQDATAETGRFPVAQTGWVPATPCCQQPGRRCAPVAADWAGEPWQTLRFRMTVRHYYQYRYRGDGQTVTLEARGDLDCDGQYSSFRQEGSIQDGRASFTHLVVEDEIE